MEGLNPSSLIDLKAELSKKYESFKKAKLDKSFETVKRTPLKHKGIASTKEKKKQPEAKSKPDSNEEDIALQKSRSALEAKTRLYNQLTSSKIEISEEQKDLYLVDFERKVLYGDKKEREKSHVEDDESISDFRNRLYAPPANYGNFVASESTSDSFGNEGDEGSHVHYQDLLNNEVRDHGIGYFAFSTDDVKRKKQMEDLSSLRQETADLQQAKQKLLKKRTEMLQARIAKVCERRNINQDAINEVLPKTESLEDPNEALTRNVELSSIPLPETKEPEVKQPKVRPWDRGKVGVPQKAPEKRKLKTQEAWADERRSERVSEFAPPSFYDL